MRMVLIASCCSWGSVESEHATKLSCRGEVERGGVVELKTKNTDVNDSLRTRIKESLKYAECVDKPLL